MPVSYVASLYQCQCVAEVCDHMCVWWCVPPLSCPAHVQEVQGFQSTAQVERLLLEHGERVVDRLGAEIDRIEIKIKVGWGRGWGSSHSHTHSTLYTHAHKAVG